MTSIGQANGFTLIAFKLAKIFSLMFIAVLQIERFRVVRAVPATSVYEASHPSFERSLARDLGDDRAVALRPRHRSEAASMKFSLPPPNK